MMIDVNPINDCGECVFNNDFVYCNLANECTNYRNGEFDLSFCPLLYLEKIKSEQAHEIVRCKDCKNHGTMDCPMCEEGNCIFHTADNWYCADGERKEVGEVNECY